MPIVQQQYPHLNVAVNHMLVQFAAGPTPSNKLCGASRSKWPFPSASTAPRTLEAASAHNILSPKNGNQFTNRRITAGVVVVVLKAPKDNVHFNIITFERRRLLCRPIALKPTTAAETCANARRTEKKKVRRWQFVNRAFQELPRRCTFYTG